VQRRIQKIQMSLHYLFGFASIFPNRADRSVWIDALVEVLPVHVLASLFCRLMLEKLIAAHGQGLLRFFGDHARLGDKQAFATHLAPLKKTKWFVCSKKPFSGPAATLAYLGRYTHRVAIANSRLIKADKDRVIFRCKDHRAHGRFRQRTMSLKPFEFIRRFLIHVLPDRFHRIRHYGPFANGQRAANLDRLRTLLNAPPPNQEDQRRMISHHASSNAQEPYPADNLLWSHTTGLCDLKPEDTLIQVEHAPPRPTPLIRASCNPPKRHQTESQSIPQRPNPHGMSHHDKRSTTSNAVSFPEICPTPNTVTTRNNIARRASNKSNHDRTFRRWN
jgi:hypothetical protein